MDQPAEPAQQLLVTIGISELFFNFADKLSHKPSNWAITS